MLEQVCPKCKCMTPIDSIPKVYRVCCKWCGYKETYSQFYKNIGLIKKNVEDYTEVYTKKGIDIYGYIIRNILFRPDQQTIQIYSRLAESDKLFKN